jgi:hypothetical protein
MDIACSMLARLARHAAAVALVLALILGFWLHLQKGMAADDDNLWLYYLTQKLTQSELATSYEQQVIDYARAKDGTAESLARLEMRRDYGANYILPITVGTGLSWLWPAPADQSRYSDYLARFMTTLFSLQAMLALLVVMLVVSQARQQTAQTGGFMGWLGPFGGQCAAVRSRLGVYGEWRYMG